MADKTIVCRDCGKEFLFTEGEQAFYKEKGFDNEPVRCVECRRARKAQNNRKKFCFLDYKSFSYSLFILSYFFKVGF